VGRHPQHFSRVHDIEYADGSNGHCQLKLHVVVCVNSWQRVDQHTVIVNETAYQACLSSQPISRESFRNKVALSSRMRQDLYFAITFDQKFSLPTTLSDVYPTPFSPIGRRPEA